jgi:hypothetical protein
MSRAPNVVPASPPGNRWGYVMNTAERHTQVRNFVQDVWNGRNYEAAASSERSTTLGRNRSRRT